MAEQETRSPDEAAAGDERQQEDHAKNGGDGTVAQELKQAVRQAALDVLGPAARRATKMHVAGSKPRRNHGYEIVADRHTSYKIVKTGLWQG